MANEVDLNTKPLKATHAELESRVEARTRELEQANRDAAGAADAAGARSAEPGPMASTQIVEPLRI